MEMIDQHFAPCNILIGVIIFLHAESELRYARWKKAVQRAMNWETTEPLSTENGMCVHCLNLSMDKLMRNKYWFKIIT